MLRIARTDVEPRVRHNALDTLHGLDVEAAEIVPLLVAALKDPESYQPLRINAARQIRRYGAASRDAVPLLLRLLKSDRTAEVRARAAVSIVELSDDALPKLRKLASGDAEPAVRKAASASVKLIHALDPL